MTVFALLLLAAATGQAQMFVGASGSPFTASDNPLSIAVGDFNRDGKLDLVTGNNGGTIGILFGNGSGGFAAASTMTLTGSNVAIRVGDFNLDGNLDLAVVNAGPGTLSILLGSGNGLFTLAPGSPIPLAGTPNDIVVGDFNRDNKLDLAIVVGNQVVVMLGTGQGSFAQAPGSPLAAGVGASNLVAADFNGDGILDLAATNTVAKTLSVWLGSGTGTFTASQGSGVSTGDGAAAIVSGDFNGDGKTDLAMLLTDTHSIGVFLGDGTGSFSAATGSPIQIQFQIDSEALATADLDGDGILDLVAGVGTSLTVMLGNGSGGFAAATGSPFSTPAIPSAILVADFNQDGKPDLATASQAGNNVSVLLNNLAGIKLVPPQLTFWTAFGQAADSVIGFTDTCNCAAPGNFHFNQPWLSISGSTNTDFAVHASAKNLAAAGVYNGILRDIRTGSFGAVLPVKLNVTNPSGGLGPAAGSPFGAGGRPAAVTAADFDGDGKLDLAITDNDSQSVTVLKGNGSGGFTLLTTTPLGATPIGITSADFNRDGKMDLAVVAGNTVRVLIGNGGGGFTQVASLVVGGFAQGIVSGDFDHDGTPDLAIANFTNPGTVAVFLNDGFGAFFPDPSGTNGQFPAGAFPASLALGDFDNDGNLDLAVSNRGFPGTTSGSLTLLLGNGKGGFTASAGSPFNVGSVPFGLTVGDLNGDGNQDVAVASQADNKLFVLLGDGHGGLVAAPGSPIASTAPVAVTIADFDGDGKPDLAVLNGSISNQGNLNLLLGDGTGAFTPFGPFATGGIYSDFVTADFNADGRPDLAVLGTFTNDVTVLLAGPAASTVTLTSSPQNSIPGGQPLTLTATVALTSPAFVPLAGSVQFKDGSTVLGTVALTNGTATFQTSTLTPAVHQLTAVFTGSLRLATSTSSAITVTVVAPAWTIAKTHTGNIIQGQNGVTYNIRVGNSGTSPTSGQVLVSEVLPNGLTLVSMSGANWNCPPAGTICTRNDALAGGTNYSDITVTVNVAATAPASVTNQAMVTGGGAAPQTANDPTTILVSGAPVWIISKTHTGNFTQGQTGAAYTIFVGNSGGGATSGQVTVTETIPTGLTLTSMSGTNWICAAGGNTCTRSDSLNPGALYPAIIVKVSVAIAAPASVTNQVAVSGGGAAQAATASDATTIAPLPVGTPGVVSITPVVSSGASQSYTFQFSDTAGFASLGVVNVLINNVLDGRQACYLAYSVPDNVLYLVPDSGGGLLTGLTLNGTGSTSNGQCTVTGSGSSASGSGNILTLTLNMSFSTSFGGNKVVYAAARDPQGDNTGWIVMGVHGAPPLPATFPNPLSISPSSGTAASETLTFTYQDAGDASNLQTMWALVNTAIDGRGACYVAYYAPGNQLFLYPDNGDGSQAASILLTGTNSLSNSQCTVSSVGSGFSKNGAQATLTLNFTFKPAFAGNKAIWLAAQTLGLVTSNWQALGARTVPGN